MRQDLLPSGANWYRANLHCHTTHSDGYWPPARVKAEYRKQGYSIVAFSDHNVLVPHPELRDETFLPITSTEYNVDSPEALFEVPPGVSVPPERGVPWTRRVCYHLNLFSKVELPAAIPGRNTLWGAQRNCFEGTDEERERRSRFCVENVNHLIAECSKAGFLVQYNHPNWSLNRREDYQPLRGLWALEILNWATEIETGGEWCPYIYDDMLRTLGPGLFCSMGDDNHNHGGDLEQSFGGSTFIAAPELTYEAVLAAMERGDIFCAEGREDPPRFLGLRVEDDVLHVDCTPVVNVNYVAMGRIYVHKRGRGVVHAEFPLRPEHGYFRVQLVDDRGNHACTHAYSVAALLAGDRPA